MKYLRLIILVVAVLGIPACARQGTTSLIERHHQFSMAIGKMEDQIDLIQLPGQSFQQSIDLVMKNGLFFVSNGAARKVMEFSSYGDLLTLYYNKNTSPTPVLLGRGSDTGAKANRKAFVYPFSEVGSIGITDSGLLLVQDAVAEDRQLWDPDTGSLLRNVILRFNEDGTLVDYIGQEGVSGTPFGYIDSISVGLEDDLTVITRTLNEWIVFSFDIDGLLRYTFTLSDEILPVVEPGDVASLDVVVAAPETDRLYVKADYYRDQLAAGEGGESDYRFLKSSLHWFNMKTGAVAGSLDLPPAVRTSGMAQMFNREEQEIIQYLAGVSEGGHAYLVSQATEDSYSLAIVNLSGLVVHRGTIELIDSETLFRKFYVTRDGILTALIGGNTEADIVLWRTDKYLSGENENR
jgi:hypothetical protein